LSFKTPLEIYIFSCFDAVAESTMPKVLLSFREKRFGESRLKDLSLPRFRHEGIQPNRHERFKARFGAAQTAPPGDSRDFLVCVIQFITAENIGEQVYFQKHVNLRAANRLFFQRSHTDDETIPLKAMDVSPIDTELLDAVVKLARMLDTPDEIKFLAPLIIREIVFRLLKGEQGARLSHLLASEGGTRRISKAVKQLRENIDQPLKIENIAREIGMSVSGFHHHFKSVTAMSPLQFQKQLRLQEARRLMLGEDLDVSSASFRVGYEDPSYFSREYKKLFGAPPQRDIARLRSNLEV
jgi:AraC-like DNA-binding protein